MKTHDNFRDKMKPHDGVRDKIKAMMTLKIR